MIEVHYLGVLLSAVAAMIVGFLWYSPMILGKPWMKEMGLTPEKLKKAQKEMGKLYGLSFIAALITAYVLTHVIVMSVAYFHYPKTTAAMTSAFFSWLGFVMPVQLTDQIFGSKKWKLFAINTGYQLVALLAMGLVLAMF